MNKKYVLGLTVILIFLLSNVTSGVAVEKPYTIGDQFTFSVSELSSSMVINGTDYSIPVNIPFAKSTTVTITNVTTNGVSLSYKSNGENINDTISIDGFRTIIVALLLVVGVNFKIASPSTSSFAKPSKGYSNSAVESLISNNFFPMFASGNTTFYQELINSTLAKQNPINGGYIITTNTSKDLSNSSKNSFTLAFDISMTKSNTTENFSYSFDISFKAVIDLTTNVLTELSFTINTNLQSGSATKVTNDSFKVIEGSLTKSTGLPGFEFMNILAVFSMLAILYLIKGKRK